MTAISANAGGFRAQALQSNAPRMPAGASRGPSFAQVVDGAADAAGSPLQRMHCPMSAGKSRQSGV